MTTTSMIDWTETASLSTYTKINNQERLLRDKLQDISKGRITRHRVEEVLYRYRYYTHQFFGEGDWWAPAQNFKKGGAFSAAWLWIEWNGEGWDITVDGAAGHAVLSGQSVVHGGIHLGYGAQVADVNSL